MKINIILNRKWVLTKSTIFLFLTIMLLNISSILIFSVTTSAATVPGTTPATTTPATQAAPAKPKYLDVNREGWNFYKIGPDIIIARGPAAKDLAVFKKDGAGNYNQRADYFWGDNGSGSYWDCGAWIGPKNTDTQLNEPKGCPPDNNNLTIGSINSNLLADGHVFKDVAEAGQGSNEMKAIIPLLNNKNWGDTPTGCPGFGGTPPANANYRCPDPTTGKQAEAAIINGKLETDPAKVAAGLQAATAATVAANNASSNQSPVERCEDQGGVFGWIFCHAAAVADDFASVFERYLANLLRVGDIGSNEQLKASWQIIVRMTTIVIIVIALIIAVSQIFGFEFLSAYSVKKALPRLVIGVIAIQISWYLAVALVAIVNALGDGIQSLMLIPFGELGKEVAQGHALSYILGIMMPEQTAEFEAGGILVVAAPVVGMALAGAAAASGGIGFMIMGALMMFVTVAVAFITLVLRLIFIWGLVVIMPLAIAMWILPGTEKWWQKWWTTYWKLLFMYPMIIGLLTIGKIGAYLAASSAAEPGNSILSKVNSGFEYVTYNYLPNFATVPAMHLIAGIGSMAILAMVLIAYFAPYFMVPSSFKFGGEFMGKVSGGLQSFGKKYSGKARDAGGKKLHDGIASGYKPGGNRFKNSLVRTASGGILPGRNSRIKMAQRSAEYAENKNKQDDYLTNLEYQSQGSYDEQGAWLQRQMAKGGKEGKAAARLMAQTGRWNLVDGTDPTGKRSTKQDADIQAGMSKLLSGYAIESPDFGQKIAPKRADKVTGAMTNITKPNAGVKVTDLDDSFFADQSRVDQIHQSTWDQIATLPQLQAKLGSNGLKALKDKTGAGAGAGAGRRIDDVGQAYDSASREDPLRTRFKGADHSTINQHIQDSGGLHNMSDTDLQILHDSTRHVTQQQRPLTAGDQALADIHERVRAQQERRNLQ